MDRCDDARSNEKFDEVSDRIAALERENEAIRDENTSLWFLIDEITKSDRSLSDDRFFKEVTSSLEDIKRRSWSMQPQEA